MADEALTLNATALYGGAPFNLEVLDFTPAAKRPEFADNAGADGELLVREAHYTNSSFEIQVRVSPQANMDTALTKLGELRDAIQACERIEGGVPLEWKPAGATTTYTYYAIVGEETGLPIVVEGDDAGYFLNAPVLRFKLTCRPFGYTVERTVKAATESGAEPLQVVYVGGIKGDVPAEGRLVLTDKATQDRRYVAIGRDVVETEAEPDILLTAAELVVTGFSGSSTTRAGGFPNEFGVGKVKRATAVTEATTMCGTGVISNVGSYRVLARIYTDSEDARIRLSYRVGDGALLPAAPPHFLEPPVVSNFAQLDLGEITLEEVTLGTQKSELRIEVKTAGQPAEIDLNYLMLIPTSKGYGVGRGLAASAPTKLLAYDTFLQAEGALAGKTLPLGGTWAGAGDVDDFTVIAASGVARRTAVSDSGLGNGRYAIAGLEEPTTAKASVHYLVQDPEQKEAGGASRRGVFLRYTATTNWLMASVELLLMGHYLKVRKCVAGVETSIGKILLPSPLGDGSAKTVVSLEATAEGAWRAWAHAPGATAAPLLSGHESVLATGGALAKGRGGFYDSYIAAGARTREFDDFSLLAGDLANRVCYSGKEAELRHDGFLREDSTGTYYGTTSLYRGADLYLEPAGGSGRINRVVVAMRRNDVETELDTPIPTDKHSLTVLARERFLAPR